MNRILLVAAAAALAVPAAARADRLATSRADRQGAVAPGVGAPAPSVPATPPMRVRDRGGVAAMEAPPSVTVMGKVHLAVAPKVTDLQGSPIQPHAARPAGVRLEVRPILVDLQGDTTLEEARTATALAGNKLRGSLQLARVTTELDTNEDAAPVRVAQGDGALR